MTHRPALPNVTFLALGALLCVFGAVAAEVVPRGVEPPGCEKLGNEMCVALSLRGRIVVGDAQNLAVRMTRIDTAPNQGVKMRVGMVKLDSPGGDVAEALKIGKLLRAR